MNIQENQVSEKQILRPEVVRYPAFSGFKDNVGNNNHFLITSCIGLSKVSDEDRKMDFPAAWNPQNVKNSVKRSKKFIIKAALAWVIDCVDVLLKDFFPYFFSEQKHFVIEGKDEPQSYENVLRSVYYKVYVVEELFLEKEVDITRWRKEGDYRKALLNDEPYFPDLKLIFALLDLAIQWRNNLVHQGIDNKLKQSTYQRLNLYEKVLNSNTYGDLDKNRMLNRFKTNEAPSFKEVSVLIRNVIDFGFVVNAYWLRCVDRHMYTQKCLAEILPENIPNKDEHKQNISHEDRIQFYQKLKGLAGERRLQAVCNKLKKYGITLKEHKENTSEENCIRVWLQELELL